METTTFLVFKALHLIAVIAWFAGLFYLPRLYVYHTMSHDDISYERFVTMEHKLYYYIMTPAAFLTLAFGLYMLFQHYTAYSHMMWLHLKFILVATLYLFHFYLGKLLHAFKQRNNKHSEKFFRYLNEYPTFILIAVVLLTVVKPSL